MCPSTAEAGRKSGRQIDDNSAKQQVGEPGYDIDFGNLQHLSDAILDSLVSARPRKMDASERDFYGQMRRALLDGVVNGDDVRRTRGSANRVARGSESTTRERADMNSWCSRRTCRFGEF